VMLARSGASEWGCAAAVIAVGALVAAVPVRSAAPLPDFSGSWTLNRSLSELPTDVGFGVDLPVAVANGTLESEGRRGRGAGSEGPLPNRIPPPQSQEAVAKQDELVAEVRNPPASLTIAQNATGISITDADGRKRLFHTNGAKEVLMLDAGPVDTVAKWNGSTLAIEYTLDKDRQLRYTYEASSPSQLKVRAQMMLRRRGGIITRVYDKAPK